MLSIFRLPLIVVVLSLFGCATPPPKDPENICHIFTENRSWYKSAKKMNAKWGAPIHVPMAMMYQESSFRHNARPPMRYWWIIPIGRASDAYGYAQAKTMTWDDYVRETDRSRFANRANFDDAIDFMGWFMDKTYTVNGVSKWDARSQYLNYHEGWGGFRRGTYHQKAWLLPVADRVDARSRRYAGQLRECQKDLDRGWLWRLFFA